MRLGTVIISAGVILGLAYFVLWHIGGSVRTPVGSEPYRRITEKIARSSASIVATTLSRQVREHATNDIEVENITRDYFSKLRRNPESKRLEFYISRNVETWKEIDMRNGGSGYSNIVWCIKTCEDFPNEWMVMRAPCMWEYGDFSIVDPEFIKSSFIEYCSYYGAAPSDFENAMLLPNYKYGGDASQERGTQ